MTKALKAGTRIWKIDGKELQVIKKDSKPYKFLEYRILGVLKML